MGTLVKYYKIIFLFAGLGFLQTLQSLLQHFYIRDFITYRPGIYCTWGIFYHVYTISIHFLYDYYNFYNAIYVYALHKPTAYC